MPFGLKNAPVFFQRVMDQVLEGADFLECYIDDVLVHSKGLEQHLTHLEELFKRLIAVDLKIHPKKCEFAVTSVVYLGHRILPNGIMAHWAKVVAILEMPNPNDVSTRCEASLGCVTTIGFTSGISVPLLILCTHY